MARVNEGSRSFTCHPHVYPRMELAILPLLHSRRASPHFGRYSFPVQLRVGCWGGLRLGYAHDMKKTNEAVCNTFRKVEQSQVWLTPHWRKAEFANKSTFRNVWRRFVVNSPSQRRIYCYHLNEAQWCNTCIITDRNDFCSLFSKHSAKLWTASRNVLVQIAACNQLCNIDRLKWRHINLLSNQIKSNLINNKGLKATYRLLRHWLKQ